jgi:tetratricopeptide (TPR) repeat protein
MQYSNGTGLIAQGHQGREKAPQAPASPNPGESNPTPADTIADVVEVYLHQAQAYYQEHQWDAAIAACQTALQVRPTARAYRIWGNTLQAQGLLIEAMGYYAQALQLAPDSPEIYTNLGSLCARRQDWQTAIDYLQKAIAKDANFAGAHWNLAKVWQKLAQPEDALPSLATALRLDPSLGTAADHLQVARFLDSTGKAEAAIIFYRQATDQDPTCLEALQRLADLLEDQGDWQEAVNCYRQVLTLNAQATQTRTPRPAARPARLPQTDSPEPHPKPLPPATPPTGTRLLASPVQRGLNLSRKDQRLIHKLLQASTQKTLLQPLSQILSSRPSTHPTPATKILPPPNTPVTFSPSPSLPPSPSPLPPSPSPPSPLSLAAHAARAANWPEAIHWFQVAIQQTPRNPVLHRNLAVAYRRNHQWDLAAVSWYRAFALDPDWPSAEQYLQVGDWLGRTGKLRAATVCYRQAMRKQPDLALAYERLAGVLAAQGNGKAAQAVRQQWGLRQPQRGPAAGPAAVQTGGESVPVAAPEQVTQQRAAAAHQRGEQWRQQGDWAAAVEAYRQAIELQPGFCWSHHNLGDCYRQLGDWAGAAAAYRQAIVLNPEFVWSHYHLGDTLMALDQWDDAIDAYRQAQQHSDDPSVIAHRLVEAYQQGLSQQPRNLDLYEALGEQQVIAGKVEEAIATLQMALQIEPGQSGIALKLSHLLADQDPHQAQQLRQRAQQRRYEPSTGTPADLLDVTYAQTVLAQTALFDQDYYRRCYPEVAETVAGTDLAANLTHYLREGVQRGYNPNPLFDTAYYLSQYGDVARLGVNPLAHYHLFGYRVGRDPHPFFSTQQYGDQNADVLAAQVNPLEHYLTTGARQGRVAFTAERLSPLSQAAIPADAPYLACWRPAAQGPARQVQLTLGVYCSTAGNYFMTEIADWLVAALRQAGHEVLPLTEQDPPPAHLDHQIVVAPHDFFYLGDGPERVRQSPSLAQAIMVNVEQPQTAWFSRAFHYLRQAAVVWDINVKSAALLQTLGLPAYWLPLGYLPDYAPLTAPATLGDLPAIRDLPPAVKGPLPALEAPLSQRPLDLHFIGRLSPRREQFFQEQTWLQQYRCFLHTPRPGLPLKAGEGEGLDSLTAVGISRRSKILLQVHQEDLPYFTWHRMAFHGFWQNTLIVTEPCHELVGLTPGEHFIACGPEQLAARIQGLLTTPAGQAEAERVRQAGHRHFKQQFDAVKLVTQALALVTRHASGLPCTHN